MHPLHQVYMGDKVLYDLYFIAGSYDKQLQVKLLTKLHQVGGLLFVLVAKALVDSNEPQAPGIPPFFGNPELIGDSAAKDGVSQLCFFPPG